MTTANPKSAIRDPKSTSVVVSLRETNITRSVMTTLPRRAFTLVELLVVITIIGILAGLISVAAVNAVYAAKQMRIKTEVDQIDAAMKAFKQQYGAYPPCDFRDPMNNVNLRSFIARAFPRFVQSTTAKPNRLKDHLDMAGLDTSAADGIRPDRALVFWLAGFNPDVTSPFCVVDSTDTPSPYTGSRTPLFGFDKTRLLIADTTNVATSATQPGQMVYVPQGGQNIPFCYFDYRSYSTVTTAQPASSRQYPDPSVVTNSPNGYAQPYALDVDNSGTVVLGTDSWANADSFQIISAGQDGHFGAMLASTTPKLFPRGLNYATEDNDNVTNFSDKASLEDARP